MSKFHSPRTPTGPRDTWPVRTLHARFLQSKLTAIAEEHHIGSFDADTFFTLHDFDSTGHWSPDDIKRMYGLLDRSNAHVSDTQKNDAVNKILSLFDTDRSGTISYAEFKDADGKGVKLPDLGFGPGHHGDDEYEYEIHHWEKYHSGPDVKIEDLTHPEDIEHFRMHEEQEREQEEWEAREKEGVIESNIPRKFLRGG